MSKTGATDAQIEEIAQREWNEHMSNPWGEVDPLMREIVMAKYRVEARHVVPPDSRIVSVDDLKATIPWLDVLYGYAGRDDREAINELMTRIRALIGDN